MSSSGSTDKARKTKRVYGSKSKHACVCCRHRQKKCRNESNGRPCEYCKMKGFVCVYRTVKGGTCQWGPLPRTPRILTTPVPPQNPLGAPMPDDPQGTHPMEVRDSHEYTFQLYGPGGSSSYIPRELNSLDSQTGVRPMHFPNESRMPIPSDYLSDTTPWSSSEPSHPNTGYHAQYDYSFFNSNAFDWTPSSATGCTCSLDATCLLHTSQFQRWHHE